MCFFGLAALPVACGGRNALDVSAVDGSDEGSTVFPDGGTCVLPCPSEESAEVVAGRCVCVPMDMNEGGSDVTQYGAPPDATVNDAPASMHEAAADAPTATHESGADAPATILEGGSDAPAVMVDAPYDAPYDSPVEESGPGQSDAPVEGCACPDTGTLPSDASCSINCPAGYAVAADGCYCAACSESCAPGSTPGPGCTDCVACSLACPPGYVYLSGCGCAPEGTEAGPPPPPDGGNGDDGGDAGAACMLEGTEYCNRGTWCELGLCPDGKTQYGCYCNSDGTSSCNLECPAPPPCQIPGEGTCPYGQECVFDACTGPAGYQLVCECYQGGDAYCSTQSCSPDSGSVTVAPEGGTALDGGPLPDAGPPCFLEGYMQCNAGTFCGLGVCPDGRTEYGCQCNLDGTATCNLDCPTPPPCVIPGLGTCPYGSTCQFGTCEEAGTMLSCSCLSAGSATCFSQPCSSVFDASPNAE